MRKLRLAGLVFLFMAGHAFAGWLEDGIKALDERRFADAQAIFEKAVAADQKDYVAQFHLALSESMQGKDGEAIKGYEKTLDLKPGLTEAQMNLGMLLAAGGDQKRAQELLTVALEKNPESAGGLVALGRSLMATGKLADAEPKLVKAAALNPQFNDAVLELANEYEKVKDWPAARRLYAPQAANPEVAERLGVVWLAEGKPEEAIAPLQNAVKQSPSSANQYALGIAYLRTKQPDQAVLQFSKAADAEPGNFEIRMTLGRALRDQKKYPAAAAEFTRGTQMKPDSRDAWSELAGMLLIIENYQEALQAYVKLESLGEAGAGLHFFRAICEDRLHMRAEALTSYEKFLMLSAGANPDQEFQARQRAALLKRELRR